MTVRDFGDQSLATRSPAALPRHVGAGAGFIYEDQAIGVEPGLTLCPRLAGGGDVRPILLGRPHAFF